MKKIERCAVLFSFGSFFYVGEWAAGGIAGGI